MKTRSLTRSLLLASVSLARLLPVPGCSYAQAADSASADRCSHKGTSVIVVLDDHDLLLCKADKTESTYAVSLGKGGVGKTRGGDNKTPVGTYSLGVPRASRKFGIFIPVGYPTQEQRQRGYTGQAIGIHGPDRSFTWAGWLNTVVDWTQGCIAVQSDEAIGDIADWVKKERVHIVHLVVAAD